MWLMTTRGFYSAVSAGPGLVQIRARRRADLEALLELLPASRRRIVRTATADYPWRVVTTARGWRRAAAALAGEAEAYTNFKAAVQAGNAGRARLYHEVWSTLMAIEREEEELWQ